MTLPQLRMLTHELVESWLNGNREHVVEVIRSQTPQASLLLAVKVYAWMPRAAQVDFMTLLEEQYP